VASCRTFGAAAALAAAGALPLGAQLGAKCAVRCGAAREQSAGLGARKRRPSSNWISAIVAIKVPNFGDEQLGQPPLKMGAFPSRKKPRAFSFFEFLELI
jgi:hypothetical protein